MLRKAVDLFEYMNDSKMYWYIIIWVDVITDADHKDANNIWRDFDMTNLYETMFCMFQMTDYYQLTFLKVFKTNVLKFINLTLLTFSVPGLTWKILLNKAEAKLELLTYNYMLLFGEKHVIGAIFHSIHQYAEVNKKYFKD